MAQEESSRRKFIQLVGASAAVTLTSACSTAEAAAPKTPPKASAGSIPRRPLGKTGLQVSCLGLGGSHLGECKDLDEAKRVVAEAIDHGINFFDNAWEYHDGRSEQWMGEALAGKRDKVVLMTKVCTHGRDKKTAMAQLEDSLKRLKTDHLDLWQVHECVYDNDPERHFAPGGVIEALDEAKKAGKVRFVGFTGHKDPSIHLAMLARNYSFDTVQMPLNCFDATFRSFEQSVLPVVNQKGMGALGMKSLGGVAPAVKKGDVTAEEALRYAMSLPVATTISGMDSIEILRQNLGVAMGFRPMSAEEMNALRTRVAPLASDGRYELYKITKKFDAKEGREQHGFPSMEELPL